MFISLTLLIPSLLFADCNLQGNCQEIIPPIGQNSPSQSFIQNTPNAIVNMMDTMTSIMNGTSVASGTSYVSTGSQYCDSLSGRAECKQPQSSTAGTASGGDNDEYVDPYKDVDQ